MSQQQEPINNTTVDHRSALIRSGDLRFNDDGTVDRRSSAVRSGEAHVRSDGSVDQRSSAVRAGAVAPRPSHTGEDRRSFSDSEIEAAWNRGSIIPGKDPSRYRTDRVGNALYWNSYGKLTLKGWDVDHSKPLSQNGTYHPNNLQPLQSTQNRYDKRDSYPFDYSSAIPQGTTPRDMAPTNVDRRSSTVKTGDLTFNADGTVDKHSGSVKSREVLVTQKGNVDRRSVAVKSGDVKFKPSSSNAARSSTSASSASAASSSLTQSMNNLTLSSRLSSSSSSSYTSHPSSSSCGSSSSSSRALAGGKTVNGHFYKGGQFVPKCH